MKRWKMLARSLETDEETARYLCDARRIDPDAEMASPDLGRDIAAAHIVAVAKGDDEWCDTLMVAWERLTGRKG